MYINATILGGFLVVSVIAIGFFSYFLAKRKTTTPILATALGCVLATVPPLGVIYLVILVCKNDIELAQATSH